MFGADSILVIKSEGTVVKLGSNCPTLEKIHCANGATVEILESNTDVVVRKLLTNEGAVVVAPKASLTLLKYESSSTGKVKNNLFSFLGLGGPHIEKF